MAHTGPQHSELGLETTYLGARLPYGNHDPAKDTGPSVLGLMSWARQPGS